MPKLEINKTDKEQKEIKSFYKKVLIIQEKENKRISRDLHDETGQMVIALGAALGVIEKEIRQSNIEKALNLIDQNRSIIQEIAGRMKLLARNLRPPALDILGLSAVLREYFSQCSQSSPIVIEFKENLRDMRLDENIEITLYRIVQEAMYNIQRHSDATHVKIQLITKDNNLIVSIEDNGKGFDLNQYKAINDFSKMGIVGIRERVETLRGNFDISSKINKGTKLTITLPIG